jgi:hypothetical protein
MSACSWIDSLPCLSNMKSFRPRREPLLDIYNIVPCLSESFTIHVHRGFVMTPHEGNIKIITNGGMLCRVIGCFTPGDISCGGGKTTQLPLSSRWWNDPGELALHCRLSWLPCDTLFRECDLNLAHSTEIEISPGDRGHTLESGMDSNRDVS